MTGAARPMTRTTRGPPPRFPAQRSPRQRTLRVVGQGAVLAILIAGAVVATADPNNLGLLWYIPYAGVGTLLVIRRPRTSIGWILLGLGWAHAIVTVRVPATLEQYTNGTFDLPGDLLAVVHSLSIGALFYLYLVLATVFPSGRFPSGRWGRLGRLAVAAGAVVAAAGLVMPTINAEVIGSPTAIHVPNPIAVLPDLAIWRLVTPETAAFPIMILVLPAAISLFVRARQARGIEREQLRWIAASIGLVVSAVITGFALWYIVPASADSGLAWIPAAFAFPTVPISVGIAVLRYRLYEIDRIISRTVGWALVTFALLAVFAGCVVGLQALLAGVTQGQTLAVAGSTLVAAAAFQPVRRRLQSMVDHRFNRARYDAERATTAFGERLRDQIDLDALSTDIIGVLDLALRPAQVSVWIRSARGP